MTSSDDLVRRARAGISSGPTKVPARALAVVTCMDARVDPLPALNLSPGDAHVIRNAGGVVTDDVVRSLVVSQRMLNTRAVDLMMHSDCGMQGLAEDELAAAIAADMGRPPRMQMLSFDDLEAELRRGVDALRGVAVLAARNRIRGLIYDVASQRARVVVP